MTDFNLNRDVIEYYHSVSKKNGVKRSQNRVGEIVDTQSLARIFERKSDLIQVTEPFLYDLYQRVENTGYLLELVDENGVILFMIGDQQIIDTVNKQGMLVGACMDIGSVGTNAISVAMGENTPCQLRGSDHYLNIFNQFTCSCAPILDRLGKTIGYINLNGYSENVHKHTLGLVVAAANAIHNHLLYEFTLNEMKMANRITHSVMETVNFGILTIDKRGKIIFINTFAEKMINDYMAVGRKVYDYFLEHDLRISILKGEEIKDRQYTLKASRTEMIIESHLIVNGDGNFDGYLMILKKINEIMDIAGRYTDLKAKMQFSMLIAEDPMMKNVVYQAKNISSSPASVMILGEHGVGKTALAEAIHNYGNRKHLPFAVVNCCNKTEEAILYQLFGRSEHEIKDGFKGKLNASVNGTVLLNDVDYLTGKVQEMLLYYIRSNKANPDRAYSRIIATSTRNINELMHQGLFSVEFYYELSVIELEIPPLRTRYKDVKALVHHFLDLKSRQLGKPLTAPEQDVLNQLYTYSYRGNINELEHLVERIVTLGGRLELDLNLKENQLVEKEIVNFNVDHYTLKELEMIAIKNSLKNNGYNYHRTAQKLGISRATLYNKLKKMNDVSKN